MGPALKTELKKSVNWVAVGPGMNDSISHERHRKLVCFLESCGLGLVHENVILPVAPRIAI